MSSGYGRGRKEMGGGDGEKRGRSWAELDSNQRRREPADLQSAPFGHFGIRPKGRASQKRAVGSKTIPRAGRLPAR